PGAAATLAPRARTRTTATARLAGAAPRPTPQAASTGPPASDAPAQRPDPARRPAGGRAAPGQPVGDQPEQRRVADPCEDPGEEVQARERGHRTEVDHADVPQRQPLPGRPPGGDAPQRQPTQRSEERRVGKEGRSRWWQYA